MYGRTVGQSGGMVLAQESHTLVVDKENVDNEKVRVGV